MKADEQERLQNASAALDEALQTAHAGLSSIAIDGYCKAYNVERDLLLRYLEGYIAKVNGRYYASEWIDRAQAEDYDLRAREFFGGPLYREIRAAKKTKKMKKS